MNEQDNKSFTKAPSPIDKLYNKNYIKEPKDIQFKRTIIYFIK